jgi:hypothetical protein
MSPSRTLTIHLLLALILFVGVSPAAAASGNTNEVTRGTAAFSIPANQCPLLPAGLSVSGSGERLTITNTHTKADGTTEIRTNELIKGVATDGNGGVHKFVYHNSSTLTIPTSGDYSISMNDSFILSGPGPHYSVGFNWRWTFAGPDLVFPPVDNWVNLHGDSELILKCDPL